VAISAISGMGGIGKTELALQYAQKQYREESYLGGVCWLRAREEVGTQIISFARSCLELIPPDDLELAEKVRWCWGRWREGTALLVFDDVQNYEDVRSFLPPQESRFKVLMTTRSRFGHPVKDFEIKVLSEEKSLELLRTIVQGQRIDHDLATAKQVCEWLGYLPLGLELVGRYLVKKKDVLIAVLWQRLQDKKLFARALLKAEPGMTASLGVTAAFELSWQDLNEKSQHLAALLSLFALAEIPWTTVEQCLPDEDAEELEEIRDQQFLGSHLLQRMDQGMYQLHQLLKEFFASKREQRADVDELKRSFCRVMITVYEQIPYPPTLSSIKTVMPAIPHLKEVTTALEPWLPDENLIQPSHCIGRFYEGQSAYAEAEQWYKHSRVCAENRFGNGHPYVAESLNDLGLLYWSQSRYGEAEPLFLQASAIRQYKFGDNHIEVAESLNNLALPYWSQGRYGEAEPLYLQALKIDQRELGGDHPYVAIDLNNLANLYHDQGRDSESEILHLQSLEIRQRKLGNDHPYVAESFVNLGTLYVSQKRYGEAEPLFLQALDIDRQQTGNGHPSVAITLLNLAYLYYLQERYDEAESLYLETLEIRQRLFKSDHADVAVSLSSLAKLYSVQGRHSEAEPLYLQALHIAVEKLRGNHPRTQKYHENLRSFLQKAIQENRTAELSDHPMTRSLIQQLQDASD